jgi:hypothetical protein
MIVLFGKVSMHFRESANNVQEVQSRELAELIGKANSKLDSHVERVSSFSGRRRTPISFWNGPFWGLG